MTVFIVVGLAGLLMLAISLVLGDVLDGLDDVLPGDVFTTAVAGAFVSALGFGGATAEALGAPAVVAWPVGLVSGVVFGWIAARFTRLVKGGGSDDTLTIEDAIGRDGKVVTAIPNEGFGVVNVLVGGHTIRLNARSDVPLEPGDQVYVTGVLSPTAVTVDPVWHPKS